MSFDNIERRRDLRYDYFHHMIEYYAKSSDEVFKGVTINISNSGLCLQILKPLSVGQEIKIKRAPSISYQPATIRWIKKTDDNLYKVGLSLL
jgi:hypothetical protein